MADDNQARMPSSQGGLMTYYDEDQGIEFDPKVVVAGSLGIGILTISMHLGIFV